jgi:hypothetical protein
MRSWIYVFQVARDGLAIAALRWTVLQNGDNLLNVQRRSPDLLIRQAQPDDSLPRLGDVMIQDAIFSAWLYNVSWNPHCDVGDFKIRLINSYITDGSISHVVSETVNNIRTFSHPLVNLWIEWFEVIGFVLLLWERLPAEHHAWNSATQDNYQMIRRTNN